MYVYLITNELTNELYVGQTISSLHARFLGHCNQGYILTKDIKKYGRENFSIELLETTNTIEELNEREIYWIKEKNCIFPNGYNLDKGGKNLGKRHPDTCKKISKALKGKSKSIEHTIKIQKMAIKNGQLRKGKKRPPFSQEWKDNISKGNKGKKLSKQHKINISKGIKVSEKAKNSDKSKYFRNNNPQYNEILKVKIARAKYKPVYCVNNRITYLSLKDASLDLDIKGSQLNTALHRGSKVKGYKFYYIYK